MMQNIKSIAITGATSSIGLFIIDECIKKGIEVQAFYRFSSVNAARIPNNPLVRKHDCDLASMKDYTIDDVHCDALIHLAWGSTKSIERNIPEPQVDNIRYTLDAVDLAERLGCYTFIGAGSQAEYGEKLFDLTEDTPATPSTAYGIAKLCAGQISRLSCKQKGIRHIWPRIVSSYGPYSPEQTVLIYLIKELLHGRTPQLTAGNQIWDFIYLEDTARAFMALLEKGRDGEVYLIGSGESRPLKEYLLKARDTVDPTLKMSFGTVNQAEATAKHLSADVSKLRNEIGWKPTVTFDEGIKCTVNWVKSIEGIS